MKRPKEKEAAIKRSGLVGILAVDVPASRQRIAALLAEYEGLIVGRAELPCPEEGMALTCVSIRTTTDDLGAFTGKLGLIEGVKVKSIVL